ncbi:transporter substrate-binding domain-containing protein [Pelagibacterium sp. 26DY04]|uniref:transporter substrate-binding domain-containing protein n=1 Tax=unclassified Pelagibacterium TaxID=2623280 RepID=UPI0028163874|nr:MULTISPECIES: transporter substrate-binding domain-containing protein [unclassified Pelagibacterium]WMT86093.1 transporter substrate-binding domain-containing protein [Pelagibacterium sp. 26DY04]WMT89619.1 transporter substrate-binding domain-containing protein [Pelagibacterium sp. H642]
MKKVILTAAALAVLSTAATAQEVLRVGTEGAYAPWNFVNDAGELAGFEIDLANAICEHTGMTCEFVQSEWDPIIPNLIAGNYDVIMAGMSITDERLETINFTQNYFPPDPSKFLAAAGSGIDPATATGLRIGVQSNTIQAGYAEENLGDDNTIVAFATFDQSIADLAAGNVDVVLADGSSLDPVVANSGGALEFVGEEVRVGGGVGGGVRKEDTELLATLDEALTALKADGTVDALIAEWFDGQGPYFAE